ncbi:hypothetical protein ACLOJK_040219 [Asimina triloba]
MHHIARNGYEPSKFQAGAFYLRAATPSYQCLGSLMEALTNIYSLQTCLDLNDFVTVGPNRPLAKPAPWLLKLLAPKPMQHQRLGSSATLELGQTPILDSLAGRRLSMRADKRFCSCGSIVHRTEFVIATAYRPSSSLAVGGETLLNAAVACSIIAVADAAARSLPWSGGSTTSYRCHAVHRGGFLPSLEEKPLPLLHVCSPSTGADGVDSGRPLLTGRRSRRQKKVEHRIPPKVGAPAVHCNPCTCSSEFYDLVLNVIL